MTSDPTTAPEAETPEAEPAEPEHECVMPPPPTEILPGLQIWFCDHHNADAHGRPSQDSCGRAYTPAVVGDGAYGELLGWVPYPSMDGRQGRGTRDTL